MPHHDNPPVLLRIEELGQNALLNIVFEQLPVRLLQASNRRKALSLIKSEQPSVIVAEFVYCPTYGSQLSNFESIFAALQNYAPECKLVALVQIEDLAHYRRVSQIHPPFACHTLPVSPEALKQTLLSLFC